jgi:urease accessory protein
MKKCLVLLAGFYALPALAHHPLGGQPMTTFFHGLLSGIGHPLLGFDHLFFIVLVGIAALYTGYARSAPAAYIAAMLAGCVLVAQGANLPAIEPVIGLSLLVLGGIVLSGKALKLPAALALFAVAGLFHGAAFGGAMATVESGSAAGVLAGYLVGLGVVQYLLALGSGWISLRAWSADSADALQPRLAGAVVGGAGLLLTLENLEGMLFTALGLA